MDRRHLWILYIIVSLFLTDNAMAQIIKRAELTPEERRVIIDKGTERPFTGKYNKFTEEGTYCCRQCGVALYRSDDKFDSGCGWPAFDQEIKGAVKRVADPDGERVEIICNACGAHLGHVFTGEKLTDKNVRHCVNSISLEFKPTTKPSALDSAYFAGGCFWGVEHLLQKQDGVYSVESGYMGGWKADPTYEDVCSKKSGHAEVVKVLFDPSKVDYQTLARLFFEIHDPTQSDRQGPDVGSQYRSEIFYVNPLQKEIANKLIEQLKAKGYKVVTQVTAAPKFYSAEKYHQDYYQNKGTEPYCHSYVKRF